MGQPWQDRRRQLSGLLGSRAPTRVAADRPGVADGEPIGCATVLIANYKELLRLAIFLTHDPAGAEDLLQDVYLRVCGRTLASAATERAYVRRAIINASRSNHRHHRIGKRVNDLLVAERRTQGEAQAPSGTQMDLLRALQLLPRRQREVVVLQYLEGMSLVEVGSILGIATGTVKSHSARGVSALRHLLKDYP